MPYHLISDGETVPLGDRKYLLSPQDLAGLEVLPQIVRAGVASLKIEGRLKAPEYVANITRHYRQALDRLSVSEPDTTPAASSMRWKCRSRADCTPAGSVASTTRNWFTRASAKSVASILAKSKN